MALTNTEKAIRARERRAQAATRKRELEARPVSKAKLAADAKAAKANGAPGE